jgi:hypothetical protein
MDLIFCFAKKPFKSIKSVLSTFLKNCEAKNPFLIHPIRVILVHIVFVAFVAFVGASRSPMLALQYFVSTHRYHL